MNWSPALGALPNSASTIGPIGFLPDHRSKGRMGPPADSYYFLKKWKINFMQTNMIRYNICIIRSCWRKYVLCILLKHAVITWYLLLFWLAVVITLVLGLRHLVEKPSIRSIVIQYGGPDDTLAQKSLILWREEIRRNGVYCRTQAADCGLHTARSTDCRVQAIDSVELILLVADRKLQPTLPQAIGDPIGGLHVSRHQK